MDIKFIQINKGNILAHWHFWHNDLSDLCSDKYTVDMNLDTYMNMLIHPQSSAILWAGFVDGNYHGLVITLPEGDNLLIHTSKAKPTYKHELFRHSLTILENYAKQHGFKRIKFITKRDRAFQKKMEPLGYKAEQTIFYKEV